VVIVKKVCSQERKNRRFVFLFYGILLASILITKYSYINILCQDIYSQIFIPRTFAIFFVAGCIGHKGAFCATTIGLLASLTTPAAYVLCIGQAVCRDFDTGNAMGSGTA
jgi:hypothetical protein